MACHLMGRMLLGFEQVEVGRTLMVFEEVVVGRTLLVFEEVVLGCGWSTAQHDLRWLESKIAF